MNERVSLLEQYQQVRAKWSKQGELIPYAQGVGIHASFELAYHASNTPSLRCFHVKVAPGEDAGSQAALLDAKTQIFNEILGIDKGIMLTSYGKEEALVAQEHTRVKADYVKFCGKYPTKDEKLKDQISLAILVERKVDEVIDLTLKKEKGGRVYFAVGETRERAANIPLIMEAENGSIVQLALQKWMSTMSQAAREEPIKDELHQGIIKNFLQIKKWLLALVTKTLAS